MGEERNHRQVVGFYRKLLTTQYGVCVFHWGEQDAEIALLPGEQPSRSDVSYYASARDELQAVHSTARRFGFRSPRECRDFLAEAVQKTGLEVVLPEPSRCAKV